MPAIILLTFIVGAVIGTVMERYRSNQLRQHGDTLSELVQTMLEDNQQESIRQCAKDSVALWRKM